MRAAHRDRRRRPARPHPAGSARRDGRRHLRGQQPALRHADGQWRAPRRVSRHPRRVQALDAGATRRRQRRRPRGTSLSAGAADARAAHPARKGDQQHLHRAGASGRRRQHVRRLPRADRADTHRFPGGELHRDPGGDAARPRLPAAACQRLRHARDRPASAPPRSISAASRRRRPTCGERAPPASASPSTRRPPARMSRCCARSSHRSRSPVHPTGAACERDVAPCCRPPCVAAAPS